MTQGPHHESMWTGGRWAVRESSEQNGQASALVRAQGPRAGCVLVSPTRQQTLRGPSSDLSRPLPPRFLSAKRQVRPVPGAPLSTLVTEGPLSLLICSLCGTLARTLHTRAFIPQGKVITDTASRSGGREDLSGWGN